ncbi:uncharacterized protein LOC114796725 isoform X2 [Denticeps clupeoides]|nr:uncharacterized protein LOC114796725 isoform X2 [Denticeps clupeoides]XP_028847011.1 uncharacterized protein LOC114796725 isoform X2 [Denticeps clupeoides]
MACTQQSAVEYIKNARVILVEQLKNQPLIVEKLREKEVLNLHQCTEINEEPKTFEKNRKILDFVTSKGNKACYELLRVLNTTRQRTLPKPTGQQKDLHHWISCFPFTEDQEMEPSLGSKACQEYQKQLRREAQKILQASVRQKKCLGGDAAPEAFCYTPLVLDPDTDHNSVTSKIQTKSKKYKKSRPKKLKSFIPKAQGQLSPEDLLWGEKNLIVLVGKPGIGKSTVTHQMLHLWCERQNGGLDYLFYLDDRLLSTSTPAQLESLFDSYVEPRESREEVYEDITEHSENVTIIFDGLTDVLLHPLLEKIITKSILEDARIVITCRPEQLFDLSERIDPHVVHVQGFSEESIRTYLTEKLSDQPDAVASVVEHLELFSLCHVPLHAFMVAVCISFLSREADRSWNVTEIHLHIFRQIIMKCENVSMRNIDGWIRKHGEQILSLAEIARNATLQKTLDIRDHEASGIQCHFLKSLSVMDTPTSVRNHSAFLNSSMQDFFGALWLLCHPAEIDAFLQKCWTEEGKHLKYTIPFLCGFMSERNIPLLKGLVPKTQIQLASDCFHEKLLRLLFEPEGDQHFEKSEEEELSNIADDEDLLFHCQCLYESQSPEACLQFLERLKWHLDLSGSHLDPHQCCTLAYVISQSKEQKVHLELKKCRISDPGVKMILGCSQHFSSASTLCHVWLHVLSSEDPRDFTGLLAACGNELHLPVGEQPTIFKNAGGILRRSPGKINLCLHWDTTTHHLSKALWTVIFSEFPHIHSIRLNLPLEDQNLRLMSLHQDLCVLGAEFFFQILYGLHSSHKTPAEMGLFLMDLYSSLMKSFLPALQPVYQPASPAVWTIELSERKTSIFLEVLKMQTEKKPVELRGWSDEGSEVRSFLQSLKYISHIGLTLQNFSCSVEQDEIVKMFLLNLCLQSAHYHIETVKTTVETLMVLFREHCKDRSSFLLDLCSHVKNYESQTGRSFLPALQPVYQSASPAVWTIDLSERKTSIFLEVLKMQTEKKPVELRGWSDEESEVRSFLQCLNYVSQLRFPVDFGDFVDMDEFDKRRTEAQKVLLNLIIAAVKWDAATGESFCNILTSVCSYKTFPLGDGFNAEYLRTFQSNFLHDLYSHVKNYESQTGRSFLPALQPVYQSAAPAVWTIDLSERKASIFLEVLKMQIVKKPVELRGWSDEESEVRSFLQCLNYVSQLRFDSYLFWRYKSGPQFLLNLFTAAAEWDAATGESFSKILTSVCSYKTFPRGDDHFHDNDDVINQSDFLLDLYSHVKNYESQTGRSFLPALQPVYQSASPAVWTIDLSERKASIFLEVLKMQSEKKPVELRGWSDEESEVRSFLQCLNYVSQLRFTLQNKNTSVEQEKRVKMFLLDLCLQAALSQTKSIKTTVETLMVLFHKYCRDRSSFLLDLCSHVKNYESQTGGSFLPALQPVYQSASPAVWTIDLSERKASIFLEVLKMQSEKKPVELRGWSDKESEVRSFLQCLNYVSQLRFTLQNKNTSVEQEKRVKMFLLDLCLQAALSQTKSIKTTVETLMVLFHKYCRDRSSFLLDLCSHVKNYESQTGGSFLPALQPVYQSAAPAVWTIELSEKKASIFLEVLKMQTEKKPVELRGLSDEESEVRSFLQCLNYVSQLRFCVDYNDERRKKAVQFLLNLITASAEWDAATGESFSKILTSVCSYKAFPHGDGFNEKYLRKFQSDFLLDLYSHVKNYESQTGRSFLPALQPVYQSAAPAVWTIYLSERKTSIFLEVLKMQTEKKPVELRGWSDEESEVRSFLQCLNYVSQLRFYVGYDDERRKKAVQVLLNLITAAAEWDADTGESFSKILTSVCSYKTFPRGDDHFGDDDDDVIYHSDFLLDLCSHVKNYESQTGRSFLPALQPVYQSASPAVWTIDLSERKASIFLEVLKMQPEKKPVKLRGWSDEESEVRSFLQCLKYVSQLSGADEFFPAVCKAVGPRQVEQVTPLLQAMGFTLTLGGDLSSHCCRSVGRVLGLSASRLDLTLQPEHISLRGTRLIFKHIHTLHKLRLNKKMLFRITRALRSQGGCSSFTIEELSFIQPEGALSSVMSSMVLLLRHWTVRCLDLTACQIEAQSVTGLLMYQGLLTIRLSAESLQLLTLLVYEAHEEELTQHFLQKVSGDLTSCSLNWEVIHYLLQVKGPPITVDFRRNKMTLQNIRDIFPHGNRVMIKRLPPRFLMVIMREIYETRAAHCVSSLLKWSEKNIVLNSRVQDAADCAALCFTLQHSEGVQLSLLWSSIPEGALENILLLLNNVSLLSVDRKLLLRLLHCCFSSELQQGAAAALLRSLQHRLNFSCDSAVDLTGPTDGQVLVLGHEDCMVVSMVIQRSSVAVELSLHDCEIEDAGLQQFFPILHKICLSCSKALLLHFLSLLSGGSEAESVKCAESLSQALGGEVDLSQTPVDPGVCGSIALLLEYSEGLSELDLSHCQLTDRCLELLLPHLQKTRVLDLSHNNITDCMTERLYSIISASSNLHTVRLFNNKIKDKKLLVTDRRVEIW